MKYDLVKFFSFSLKPRLLGNLEYFEHSQRDQGHRFLCWKMPMNGKLTRRKSLLAQEVLPIIYAKWLPSSFKSERLSSAHKKWL